VLKDYAWQIGAALLRNTKTPTVTGAPSQQAAMMLLVDVVQKLSLARGLDAIFHAGFHARSHTSHLR
jgi:hypothetical protein